MFRSSTIIRELELNMAKVMFTLKHSVKLRRYLLYSCARHATHTPFHDMLPHNRIISNDVISPKVLT